MCQHRLAHLTRAGYARTPDSAASLPSSSGCAASSVSSWCTRSNRPSASRARLALDRLGHQRGRRGRDRAALALEADVLDLVVRDLQPQRQAVAAQGIEAFDAGIGGVERAEIPRPAIVVEDHVAIQIIEFHGVLLREERPGAPDAGGKPVDFLEGVVEGERGARGGRQLEEFHHRHGAVMAGADRDAVLVENGAEIVRMHPRDDEGHQARLIARRADDASPSISLKVRVA